MKREQAKSIIGSKTYYLFLEASFFQERIIVIKAYKIREGKKGKINARDKCNFSKLYVIE